MKKSSVAKEKRSSIITISVDIDNQGFQNEEETMAYILSSMMVTNRLKEKKKREDKSEKGAFKSLNKVNRIKDTASLQTILELYSSAIAHAPLGSYELFRAYTERSEVLYNQGYYEECLKDIERITQIGCLNEMKAEMYTRKAKALWGLEPRMRPDVEKAITKARCWLTEADKETQQKVEISLSLLVKNYSLKTTFTKQDLNKLMPIAQKDNPRVIGASGSIELKCSENYGRHVVATKDIKVGEVVFVQKAYSLILSPNFWYTYCWYCSKRTWACVACNNCVNVIYCNESCRDKAWEEYHDMECNIISLLLAMGQCEWLDLMAVRITIKAIKEYGSLEALKTNLLKIDEIPDPVEKFFTDNLHDSSKYSTVYSLVHDVSFRDKSEVDGLSISSAYILHAFALSSQLLGDGINDIRDCVNNEWAVFLAGLILRNIRISSLNCFSLSVPFIDIKRGDLLGSFASFFNHSCFSNVCPVHYGNMMTFRATQLIKKGAQLFISYGSNFDEIPTTQRREQLKDDYNFWCECIACRYDWNPSAIFPTLVNKRTLNSIEQNIKELIQKNDQKKLTAIQSSSKNIQWIEDFYKLQPICDLLNLMCENLDYRCREMLSFKVLLESNYSHYADIYNDNSYIIKSM